MTNPGSTSQSNLDFNVLPLAKASEVLASLGNGVIQALFDRNTSFNFANYLDSVSLAGLLDLPDIQPVHSEVASLAQGLIGGKGDVGGSNYTLGRLISQHLGGISADKLPELFWPLAAQMAWQSPEFVYQLTSRASAHLRNHWFVADGAVPAVRVANNSIWLLLSISALQEPIPLTTTPVHTQVVSAAEPSARRPVSLLERVGHWLGWRTPEQSSIKGFTAPLKSAPQASVLVARLTRAGQDAAVLPSWAGMWDQWIVAEACALWPIGYGKLQDKLKAQIDCFPLGRPPNWAQQETKSNLVRPGWDSEKPDWFELYWIA